MCKIEDYDRMDLLPWYRKTVELELNTWHKGLQNKNIDNGTILDIGAGCGETAMFYLLHGASKVIAIEFDEEALNCLKKNFSNDDRVIILPDFIDHIKIDIDGGELGMNLETHFPLKWKKLWSPPQPNVDANLWTLVRRRRPYFNSRWKLYLILTHAHKVKVCAAHWIRLNILRFF